MGTLIIPNLQMVPFNVGIESAMFRITRSIRSLGTPRTHKWLLDTMHVVHVALEMNISMEYFAANFTFNAQLIFMRFEVRFQFIFRKEPLSAFWASLK